MTAGESGTSANGKFHQYYKCVNNKYHRGCKKKSVRKDWIEEIVVENTMLMLMDDELISLLSQDLYDLQKKENKTIPLLKKQIGEVTRLIDNMLNAIQEGVLTSSTKERLEELENRKKELEISLTNEENQKPFMSKEQIQFWLERFRKTDVTIYAQRQRLIDSFVNSIFVYDDKIVFTFNYKDRIKTINLENICSSIEAGVAPKADNPNKIFYIEDVFGFVFYI